MKCPHYSNGVCSFASSLAGSDVPTTEEACKVCSEDKTNPRSINHVTCSIALSHLRNTGTLEPRHKALFTCIKQPTVEHGPGTELEKLIGWLATSDCNCNARKFQMNEWGKQGCLENIGTIIEWLTVECDKRKLVARHIPGFRLVLQLLVRYSIWRAPIVRPSVPNQPTIPH